MNWMQILTDAAVLTGIFLAGSAAVLLVFFVLEVLLRDYNVVRGVIYLIGIIFTLAFCLVGLTHSLSGMAAEEANKQPTCKEQPQ